MSLRERKKRQTRDAIVRHALEQFGARGYEATTVASIAAAADVAPRTFFAYFPSKEDVVFHDADAVRGEIAERLAGRTDGETAFDALRSWVEDRHDELGWAHEPERVRHRLIAEVPALQGRERAEMAAIERLFAGAVAVDLGVPADSLRPHLVAAAAVAALDALGRFHDGQEVDPLAVLDEALVFLHGGLDALRRHPAA